MAPRPFLDYSTENSPFSLSEPVGAITAASNGAVIAITSVATVAPSHPVKDFTAVVALNPEIKRPEDLAGRTIAMNPLGGGTQVATSATIEKLSGEAAAINIVELPFRK